MKRASYLIIFLSILMTAFLLSCASIKSDVKNAENKQVKIPDDAAKDIKEIVVSEFMLGVGDSIDISVYRQDDLKKSVRIGPSGTITYPLIGDVNVAGRSIFDVRDEIRDKLKKYIIDPQVMIDVTAVQSQKFMVLGEVTNPGIFTLDSNLSVLQAIATAGGMTLDAKSSNTVLITRKHGKPEYITFNYKEALKKQGDFQDRTMKNGDIIYVPSVEIADVSWFFSHLGQILSPIVNLESGIVLWPQVKDAIQDKESDTSITISTD